MIVAYIQDGPNLVALAMNGWGEGEPARWWLNLPLSEAFLLAGAMTGLPNAMLAGDVTADEARVHVDYAIDRALPTPHDDGQPPAIAPTSRSGSRPSRTGPGSSVSVQVSE